MAGARYTSLADNTDSVSGRLGNETNVPSSGSHVACLWEFQLEYKVSEKLREIYFETLEEIQGQRGEDRESKAVSILANASGSAMVDPGLASYGTSVGQELCTVLNDHLDSLIQQEAWWNSFIDEETI